MTTWADLNKQNTNQPSKDIKIPPATGIVPNTWADFNSQNKTAVQPEVKETPVITQAPKITPAVSESTFITAPPKAPETLMTKIKKAVLPRSLEVKFGLSEPTIQEQMMISEIAAEKTPKLQESMTKFVSKELKDESEFVNILKDTFIPSKVILAGDSPIVNAARKRNIDEYTQEHPYISIVPQVVGVLANLILLRKTGGGFGLAEKSKAIITPALSNLFPNLTRMIGLGLESGSIFGLESAVSEGLNQLQAKKAEPKKIVTEGAKGAGMGFALGGAGALPTLSGRIAAGGATLGGITAIEGYLEDKKIDSKDLINIGVNTLIGAGFELFGGVKRTEMFRQQTMGDIASESTIVKLMSNHPSMSRAEAEKISSIMSQLDFVVNSGIYSKAPAEVATQFKNLPKDFASLPDKTRVNYFNNVSQEVIGGKTVAEAIDITNIKMNIGITPVAVYTDLRNKISTPEGQQDNDLIVQYNEASASLNNYYNANKENVFSIKIPGGTTDIANINVAKNVDKTWVYSFNVDTPENGITSDFLTNKFSNTKEEAITAAKKELLAYLKKELPNLSPEMKGTFETIIKNVKNVSPKIKTAVEIKKPEVKPVEVKKEIITQEVKRVANNTANSINIFKNGMEIGKIFNPDDEPLKFMVTSEFIKGSRYFKTQKAAENFIIKETEGIKPLTEAISEYNRPTEKKPRFAISNTKIISKTPTEAKIKPKQATLFRKEGTGGDLGFNPKNLEDLDKPIAKTETDKIIKRSEIAKQLSDKLTVPIRRGKFRMAGAIGIFKTQQKVIRIKTGGLNTVFHEVAHFLDDQFNFSKTINPKERVGLMVEYGRSYVGQPNKQRKEAFAEFVRFMMTGQEERVKKIAPDFYKKYENRMRELPEIADVLTTAADDYMRWKQQPAAAKVLSQISLGEENKENFINRVSTNLHNLYTMAKDDIHPLSEFSALAKKRGIELPAAQDPYILARNSRGWIGKAETFLQRGTFGKDYWKVENGKVKVIFKGKGLSEIIKPVSDNDKLNDLRIYLTSKRALELADRKIKTGILREDAKEAIAELDKTNPDFERISQELYKYQDDLLNYAYESGLVGKKGLEKIKELNKFRVPFYRVMEETTSAFMGGRKLAGNLGKQIKKIKGSERDIIDPLESIVKDTYAIINSAERNKIGIAMVNLAKRDFELGRLFEEVAKPMAATKVNVGEVMKKAVPELSDMIPEGLSDTMVTIFRPIQDRGANMLNVNLGDKQKVFQVEPLLFKAIQGLEAEDVGMLMRVLAIPAKLLRVGATLTPDFSVRNPLRDQFSAFIYSKYGFLPGIDLVKGIFELFKRGDVYDLWKIGGGQHAMLVSLDRENLQKTFKDIVRTKGGMFFKYVKNPMETLRIISEIGEEGTRLGEMKKALEAGADPVEAAYSSREVTLDFARIGSKTRAINTIIAFWNANVEGSDRMVRSFRDNPFRTLWKVLLGITLPSILLYFSNRKDPRWKEIPSWQKDLFWIVMTPNHIFRIPKPFELGILFGSVPERVLEYIDNKDSKIIDDVLGSIASGATPGFIPTSLLPIWENISNYSFFLDRPIVSEGQQDLPSEAQYGTYASEISKFSGKILGYSPAKIDNLIQGYTGGLGKYAISILDTIMSKTGIVDVPEPPAKGWEDVPIVKSFMVRPPVGSSSESVNRIYNLYSETSGGSTYVKKLLEEGNEETAKQYIESHPELVYTKLIQNVVSTFSHLNKNKKRILSDRDMSAEDKKNSISELDNLQTELARDILNQLKDETE